MRLLIGVLGGILVLWFAAAVVASANPSFEKIKCWRHYCHPTRHRVICGPNGCYCDPCGRYRIWWNPWNRRSLWYPPLITGRHTVQGGKQPHLLELPAYMLPRA